MMFVRSQYFNNICRPFVPPTTRTTARPVITTYRPVPDYLSSSTSKVAIADIIADLIVEHIENTAGSDGKTKDKRFLDLLSALTSLEAGKDSPPLPPGPPYLPPNRLPANSVTRPPSYLFQTVSPPPPPPPPKRIHQNDFQTNFNKNNFQETGPIKPFIKGLNNSKRKKKKKVSSLDSMLQNLLSNEVNSGYLESLPPSPPPKRAPAFYPYPQQFQNRVPVQTLPDRKPAKSQGSSSRYPAKPVNKKESSSSTFSRYPIKPVKKKESSSSAFSRYPIKIPQIKQNQHFSLPIDSLADLRRQTSEDLNGRNSQFSDEDDFVSFSDQLRLMLEDLGSRRP